MTYLRKRPRQSRSQATFDAIVEATARILVENKPRRLSTNQIAARAGVSIGSLYQYFPNRQAIVRALVERELARAEAMRPGILDDPTRPIADRVRAAVDWHLEVHAANPSLARALRGLAAKVLPAEEIRAYTRQRTRRVARTVRSIISAESRDPDTAAFIVDTCLDALSDAAAARKPAWLRSEKFRSEVSSLIRGYLSGGSEI